MKLQKWNYRIKDYVDYEIPNDWNVLIYSNSMDTECNCASCGKLIRVGNSYTSQEIHTKHGWGYLICQICMAKETERRNKEWN